ncbi:hypothetical protein [Paramicrobacterium agarici]|uniref:hypothetical protein n=1 Tax=Paramicrobacterium agarici TaxID=630514 RepID=UPI0011515F59|nr:hypothetical protein [Microbacterium agarici]TQO23822.1 hypothetical protein FB385_2684 [Microbacterium agarici]
MNDITLPNQAASQGTVVEQSRAVAEVAAAIQVAQQFPRNAERSKAELERLASSTAVAERAFYEVPNRGAGLSVHIARELARIWGNIDYGVRELRRDDDQGISEMQAWAWDQETNVRSTRSFIQPHQRMKAGRRQALTDLSDIYLNNQNTAARAVRECIFTVLPGYFIDEAESRLRERLRVGDGQPIEDRRAAAVRAFEEFGVTVKQLETKLKKQQGNWGPGELAALSRIRATITQDGIPVTEFFPEEVVNVNELNQEKP